MQRDNLGKTLLQKQVSLRYSRSKDISSNKKRSQKMFVYYILRITRHKTTEEGVSECLLHSHKNEVRIHHPQLFVFSVIVIGDKLSRYFSNDSFKRIDILRSFIEKRNIFFNERKNCISILIAQKNC